LVYHGIVKAGELKRLLSKAGARFGEAGRHTKILLAGKTSFIPRHAGRDLGSLANEIAKELGTTLADLRRKGK
jgi:hypothetical protein